MEKIIDKYNQENSNKKEKIYKVLQRPRIGENYFDNINVKSFIRKDVASYIILNKKSNLLKMMNYLKY